MADGIRKTLSHTAIYGVGNAAQSVVGFIMLPIYTRYLTPADYGIVSLLQVLLDLTSLVFGMQIANSVFRNYYKESDIEARNSVISTALGFTVIAKGAGAIALSLAATPAAALFFDDPTHGKYITVFAFALLTDSLSFIPFQFIRLQERPWLFVSLSVLKLLVQLSLNIYFIIFSDAGVMGVIYSSVLSGAVIGGGMSLWLMTKVGYRVSLPQARSLIVYSWPLIFSGFISIYLTAGNRVALTHFHGLDQVGLLALATQFSMVIRTLIWKPLNQVWGPLRFKLAMADDGKEQIVRVFKLVLLCLTISGCGISVLSENVIVIMASKEFASAASIIPILVLAEIIRCITLFANTPLLVAGRTVEVLYGSCLSALAFSLLLIALVPELGIIGAAIASLCNALVALVWISLRAKPYQDFGLPWHKFCLAIALGSVCMGFSAFAPSPSSNPLFSLTAKCGILLLLIGSLYVSPILSVHERLEVRRQAAMILWKAIKIGSRNLG